MSMGLQVVPLTLPLASYLDMARLTARGLMRGPAAGHEAGEAQPAGLSGRPATAANYAEPTQARSRIVSKIQISHRKVIVYDEEARHDSELINGYLGQARPASPST